ncbi:hypothetical protein HK405_012619 [Cladochytrium tenue]|nr:hypothetical protein HK405_012619 [Cladochytrium tenue]
MAAELFESTSTDYGFIQLQNTARPTLSVDEPIAGSQDSTSVTSPRTAFRIKLELLGPTNTVYGYVNFQETAQTTTGSQDSTGFASSSTPLQTTLEEIVPTSATYGLIQFQNTARTTTSANELTTISQVSTSLSSLGTILRTNYEQFGLISTAIDPPPAGSGGSARAAIVVPVDGGHPRNQRTLSASVSAAANQAAALLSSGQPTMMEPATAMVSSIDGDENAAPQQHARYVCECTLLPTTKEGRSGEWKLAFGCTHPLCDEIIIGEGNAKDHRHTHDVPRSKILCGERCGTTDCSKSFTRNSDLHRHIKAASGDAKKYPCECKLDFTRKEDLERHCREQGQGHRAADNGGWAAAPPSRR